MSSAAGRAGLVIAGTVIGTAIAGPWGGVAGGAIGAGLGALIFPPSPVEVQSARLDSLKVSTSSYGNPIPWIYGTGMMGGTYLWAEDIIERDRQQTETPGKGGAPTVTTTYSYNANFAIGFCRTPRTGAKKIIQVFADNKLIIDFSGTSGPVMSAKYSGESGQRFNTGKVRFFLGEETQLPDPLIESKLGIGSAPAFRGIAGVVFEEMPLGDFGNRIPQITAVVSTTSTDSFPDREINAVTVASASAALWYPNRVEFLMAGVRKYNAQSGTLISTAPALNPVPIYVDSSGALWGTKVEGPPFPHGDLYKYDGNTFQQIGKSLTNALDNAVYTGALAIAEFGPIGLFSRLICVTTNTPSTVWVGHSAPLSGVITQVSKYVLATYITGAAPAGSHCLAVDSSTGDLYMAANDATDGFVVQLNQATGNPESWWTIAGINDLEFLTYDPSTDSLIILSDTGDLIKFDLPTKAVTVQVTVPASSQQGGIFGSELVNGVLWLQDAITDVYKRYSTTDLIANKTVTASVDFGIAGTNSAPFYDVLSNALIVSSSLAVATWYQLFLDRALGAPIAVKDIVEDISKGVGLTVATQVDATDLTDLIPFYMVGQRSEARAGIEPLMAMYFFDAVETDKKAKFPQRGKATVVTLLEDDLGFGAPGAAQEQLVQSRVSEIELPYKTEVSFWDEAADYESGMQEAHRADDVITTRRVERAVFPMALDRDDARRRAEIMLHRKWMERTRYSFSLSVEHIGLDPGDSVIITLNGASHVVTLLQLDLGANFVLECEGAGFPIATVAEANAILASIYTLSTSLGGGFNSFIAQSIPLINPTRMELIDSPLFRDEDDGPGFYIAAKGVTPTATYEGSFIRRASSGAPSEFVEFILYLASQAATIGTAQAALAVEARWTVFDVSNTIQVSFDPADTIASSTDANVMAGQNHFLIGDEIVGVVTVVDDGGGLYTFSRLLRGRRGSDPFISTHVLGERVVQISATQLLHTAGVVPLTDDDLLYYYQAFSINGVTSGVPSIPFTWTGRTLMPYTVTDAVGVKSGNDWVITWIRRTRTGGPWRDYVDVPLSEETELYRVDVLDEAGVVVRSFTGLTSPTVTYTEAQIKTDFTDPILSPYPEFDLRVKIYQISADVGDGFAKDITLNARPAGDPEFPRTVFLSHFNADPPIDETFTPHSLTLLSGSIIDTTEKKFGLSSLDCQNSTAGGTSTVYSTDFWPDTGPYTWEAWVKWNLAPSASEDVIVAWWNTSANVSSWRLLWDPVVGGLQFGYTYLGGTGDLLSLDSASPWTPTADVWYYIAVDWDEDGNLSIYRDTTVEATANIGLTSWFNPGSRVLYVGNQQNPFQSFDGWIDSVRLTKGIARIKGAPVVPTTPFQNF